MNILSPGIGAGSTAISDAPDNSGMYQSVATGQGPTLQYIRKFVRWRWVILGVLAACVFIGLCVTFLMTPQYTAISTIEISRESDQVTSFQGVERETSIADQEFYQTQYGLLRSRTLAERVAVKLRLVDDPEFFELLDAEGDDPAFRKQNGRYLSSGRPHRERVAGEALLDNLAVSPTRLSRLVDIGFTSPDPEFSAKVANSWADSFIQTNLERKVQSTSYGRDQLQRQLAEYKTRLDESQRQLVGYASDEGIINLPAQTGTDGVSTQERSIVADNLAAMNTALSQATADRIAAEARSKNAAISTEVLRNQAVNSLRERRASLEAQYRELMVRFEPEYPAAEALRSQITDLNRSIGREEARVSTAFQSGYREALQRENALKANVEGLKAEYLDLRRRSIQYSIFQQEVDTNRALYDGLLQRFKEIGVAGGVGVNNVSIVDAADVPERPSSPRPLINLLLAALTGLGLGVALALVLDQLDESISDAGEAQRRLGLPVLGSVPKVEGEEPNVVLRDRKSSLFDAYLAIQTNLAFTTDHGVPRVFAVTSTRPSEGKSTTSLALSATLARGGKRVVLVDGDMRSPSVHHFGGVGHERGLSNFLTGDDNIDSLVFEMTDMGISAMSAGPIPPNAAELLVGTRLSILFDRLLQAYDHVIIDCPPVLGLADAPLIATKTEGVIYAVEADGVRAATIKASIARLESAHVRILGCVLTKHAPKGSSFGYGDDYAYAYSYGKSGEPSGAA